MRWTFLFSDGTDAFWTTFDVCWFRALGGLDTDKNALKIQKCAGMGYSHNFDETGMVFPLASIMPQKLDKGSMERMLEVARGPVLCLFRAFLFGAK